MTPPSLFTAPSEIAAWVADQRQAGRSVALVPTMGALHAGHLALIDVASSRADATVVSIFVNPLQFDRDDDYAQYPRPLDDDRRWCADRGVDAIYAPAPHAMYPSGFDTRVEPGLLARSFEGAARPGHFTGVATVVTKLLTAVRPDVAVFGEKDAQQLAVIRRLAVDLDLGVEIAAVPTVRESDGVALSSRNVRLSPDDRAAAVCIPTALSAATTAVADGVTSTDTIEALVASAIGAEPRARLDHVGVVDPATFERLERLDRSALVIVAVWFGDVRLIDNVRVSP